MAFNTTFTFSKQKLENKEQWKIFTYLAILSCFLAIVADVSPDMKMGFYLSLMLGVAASFAALIGFSLYHTAIASFLLTILVSRVSVQIGFIECFTQIIFPIMVWMAAFLLLKAAIDYQRKPKRLTTLDLE